MTKNIYTILSVLIIGAIVIVSVATFYNVLESGLEEPALDNSPATYTPERTKRTRTKRKNQYKIISNGGLFGKTEDETPAREEEPSDLEGLEETSLNITLIGTIPVEGDPESSTAIISVKSKRPPEDSYRIGDSVEGAIIKSIRRKMVVLRVNGKDEILMMNDASTEIAGRPPSSIPRRPPPGEAGPDRTIMIKKEELEETMEKLPELMSTVKFNTHITDGDPDGVQISGVKSGSILRKMGLINSDVIKSVDGRDIESLEDLAPIFSDLQSSEQLSIEIMRRGRSRTYNYKIR